VTYTQLALSAVAVVLVWDVAIVRTALVRRKSFWISYAIMLGFQLIMNGVLAGVPVVRYAPSAITGHRIVYAPVEDLLFGFAMILLTLSTWVWLGRGRLRPGPPRRSEPSTH
jgi:lycopene cyclase domain-containing protein